MLNEAEQRIIEENPTLPYPLIYEARDGKLRPRGGLGFNGVLLPHWLLRMKYDYMFVCLW